MGCGSSKHDRDTELPRVPHRAAISAPSGGPQLVPPPYRNAQSVPIVHAEHELDRGTLIQALDLMGQYLDSQGVTATLVTVGGAVNTIYLQSRSSTHDVDFFLGDPTAPIHKSIHEAAVHAARSFRGRGQRLGGNWFNNATALLMNRRLQSGLAQEALQQNTIVHQYRGQRGGIVIYAAPWRYAFCGKLNRLCESDRRPYDVADAVVYLHEHLRTSGKSSVTIGEVFQWCSNYGKNVTEQVLAEVDQRYYKTYKRKAIAPR